MSVGIFLVKIGLKTLILDMKWSIQRVNNGFALIFVCLKGKRGRKRGGCRVRWHKIAQGLCLLCRKKGVIDPSLASKLFHGLWPWPWPLTRDLDLWPLTFDLWHVHFCSKMSCFLRPSPCQDIKWPQIQVIWPWPLTFDLDLDFKTILAFKIF